MKSEEFFAVLPNFEAIVSNVQIKMKKYELQNKNSTLWGADLLGGGCYSLNHLQRVENYILFRMKGSSLTSLNTSQ